MVFVGTVEKGKIEYDLSEKLKIFLIKLEGKRVSCNIKRFYKTRTQKQMRYLFGYVLPITTAWMGYTRDEREHVYETLKLLYLKDVDEKGNEYVKSLKWDSNDPVDTQLMSWFTNQVRNMVAMRYGYNIQDPDKYHPSDVNEIVMEIERNG